MDRGKGLTRAARIGGHSDMRVQALVGLSAISAVVMLLPGCPTCPSADRANPVTRLGDPPPDPPPAPARFVAMSSLGESAQITLLDGELVPLTFRVPPPSGTETQSWIATRSRWPNMRGTGIGAEPTLATALTSGVPGLVTIAGATSVIALGMPTGQEDWEWVEPPTDENTLPPILDVLVVPNVLAVAGAADFHDLAFVARDRIQHGTNPFGGALTIGGDILVLDVESNVPTLLSTVSLEGIADDGLDLTPRGLTFAGGLVYAALDHSLVLGPDGTPIMRNGDGFVVAIDPESRMVRTTLRLPGLTHCEHIVAMGGEPPTGRVVVACAGTPETPGEVPDDAALVIIDRDPTGMELPVVTQTLPATLLSIPSPDRDLVALRGTSVAFVSTGSAVAPVLEDRLYAVNLDTERPELLASVPSDSEASPGGLGSGAHDPTVAPDGSTRFIVPAGRAGLFSWRLVPDAVLTDVFTFAEQPPTTLSTCTGMPVREIRLIP